MNNKTPVFIYAEGREDISPFMADDVKRATLAYGWVYRQLFSVNLDDVFDSEKIEKFFPENCSVFLRNLPKNNNTDVMGLAHWLSANNRVTVNFNAVGGLLASNDKQYQQTILFNDERTREFLSIAYDVSRPKDVLDLIEAGRLRFPVLLKPRDGSVGKGIVAVKNQEELEKQKRWNLMAAQDFIDSDYDWRVYVIGGVAVGALRRGGKEGDKKYDFEAQAQGISKAVETDQEVLAELGRVASAITAVAGLEYGGCDIIRDKNTGKFYALEVNTAATWEGGYNDIIGVDLATEILKWCEERSAKKPKHQLVKQYIENRLKNLPAETQERYWNILAWKDNTSAEKGNSLTARLHRCYDALLMGNADLKECYALINEIERAPLCWAGNFIGSSVWGQDGILETGCIPSAYYLAIREKYDKIAKVN